MHATIRRYEYERKKATMTTDELVQMGREIAANLSQTQGFVSFVILDSSSELEDPQPKQKHVLAIVSIYEDRVSLEQADHVLATPLDKRLASSCQQQVQVTTGEIVFQRGL
jgi:hypothetical protein